MRVRSTPILAAFVVSLAVTTAWAQPAAGLWEAKRRFGPDVRGEIVLKRAAGAWQVEVAGYRATGVSGRSVVSFALPDGMGAFEGRLDAASGDIDGLWVQQRTVVSGAPYAMPLRLAPAGAGTWRGQVIPLEDSFTFYLAVAPGASGSAPAFLRNPERNLGWTQFRADRVEVSNGKASLLAAGKDGAKGRTLAAGTYDAERKLLSIDFPNRGGNYEFRPVEPGAATHFHPRGRPSVPYRYAPPPRLDDGWRTAPVEEVGISRAAIERFIQKVIDTPMDSAEAQEDHAILIARRGRLVVEEYFHGESRDKPHDSRSASKSVAADLVGAAIHAGVKLATSDPVHGVMNGGSFPTGLEERKRALTLEHLLTMSSGLDCDDNDEKSPGYEDNMWESGEPDFYRWSLALPMARAPGEAAVYCSANANLAAGMAARAAGETAQALFKRLLGDPLQMKRYYLPLSPAGDATFTGGLRFLPRDFMKFGQVHLDGGTWNGRRIFSKEWSQRATSPLAYLPPYKQHYGYLWWVREYPYKGRTVRAFAAGGNGGQVVMVIPELELTMAFHAGNYNHSGGRKAERVYVPDLILPAIED